MNEEKLKFIKELKNKKSILQFEFEDGASWPVSSKMSPFSVADIYMTSPDILISEAKNYDVDDIIAYPVVFMYRHAIELYLKEVLEQLNVQVSKIHGIDELWNTLNAKLLELMDKKKRSDIELNLLPSKEEFDSIFEFHTVSPNSTELRYPDSPLLGGDPLLLFINFMNAKYHANRAREYFKRLEEILQTQGFPSKNKI